MTRFENLGVFFCDISPIKGARRAVYLKREDASLILETETEFSGFFMHGSSLPKHDRLDIQEKNETVIYPVKAIYSTQEKA